jgi:hypothetical protein
MYLLKLSLALAFILTLFTLVATVEASNTSFHSIGNSQSYSFSIFGSIWQDITNVINHLFDSFAPATTTIPITATNKTSQITITTTITTTIIPDITNINNYSNIHNVNVTQLISNNSTASKYVNITNVTLIFHNLNSGLNYTSIYRVGSSDAFSLNGGAIMNGSQGYQLNSNQTIISVEYKTEGFVSEGTGFKIWLNRDIGLNNNGTSLGLRFKAPNYSYTGSLDVIVNYVGGESTTSISTTTIPYSYLSHPICSPTNNTFYSYPNNVTCPSACPYESTQYYGGYGPTGIPTIEVTNVGTHVCLYSPLTTSTTSTVITTSTTTIPQTKYYTLNIKEKDLFIGHSSIGDYYYCNIRLENLVNDNLLEVANSLINLSVQSYCDALNGTGYEFSRWVGSGLGSKNSTNPNVTIDMKGNITETAEYRVISSTTSTSTSTTTSTTKSTTTTQPVKPVYYSLYVKSMSNSGNVSQSGNGIYLAGSRVLISARPPKGAVFGSWLCILGDAPTTGEMGVVCNNSDGYSGSSPNATITINSNITEIASWATPPPAPLNRSLTITSNPSNIGAQSVIRYQHSMHLVQELPNTTKYSNNASVNISVVNIPSGWQFTSWSCSGTGCYSGNSGEFNLTMNNNITETENFVLMPTSTTMPTTTTIINYAICSNNNELYLYSPNNLTISCQSSCPFLFPMQDINVPPYSGAYCLGFNVTTNWAYYIGGIGKAFGNPECNVYSNDTTLIPPSERVYDNNGTLITHWIYASGIWYGCD